MGGLVPVGQGLAYPSHFHPYFHAQLTCPGEAPAGKAGPDISSLPKPGGTHTTTRSPGPGADSREQRLCGQGIGFSNQHIPLEVQ